MEGFSAASMGSLVGQTIGIGFFFIIFFAIAELMPFLARLPKLKYIIPFAGGIFCVLRFSSNSNFSDLSVIASVIASMLAFFYVLNGIRKERALLSQEKVNKKS
ncbi:MAG: hypothetical protein V3U89_08605 [Methylophilaceae bacterium]